MLRKLMLYTLLSCVLSNAHATLTPLNNTDLRSNNWQHTYFFESGSLGLGRQELAVAFDYGLAGNLTVKKLPATRKSTSRGLLNFNVSRDPLLPNKNNYDPLAGVFGNKSGNALGGYSLESALEGLAIPGNEFLESIDPNRVEKKKSNKLLFADSSPAPLIIWVLGTGLVIFLGCQRNV